MNSIKNDEIKILALKLMKQHGLLAKGWKFKFDNAHERSGACKVLTKIITLSRKYMSSYDLEEINDTILHEIAHALIEPLTIDYIWKHGSHNDMWKQKAIEIGCNPKSVNNYKEFQIKNNCPKIVIYICKIIRLTILIIQEVRNMYNIKRLL
jgi:predicted SprT family Zn-dependent metalloprotease